MLQEGEGGNYFPQGLRAGSADLTETRYALHTLNPLKYADIPTPTQEALEGTKPIKQTHSRPRLHSFL